MGRSRASQTDLEQPGVQGEQVKRRLGPDGLAKDVSGVFQKLVLLVAVWLG